MVDRVAAVVNDDVITLSDLRWTIGYKRIPLPDAPEPRRELLQDTLDQLIEQRLIAEDAAATPGLSVSQQEIQERLEAYRKQFADDAAFEAHLEELGMSHTDLRDLIGRQLTVLKFVKLRFEPFVVVLPDQIQTFYEEEFLPKLGVPPEQAPPLELVQEQIRQILQVEMTTEDLDDWMTNARRRASIRVLLFEGD